MESISSFLSGLIPLKLNTLLQEKMSKKVTPSIQSLKSMPADYRFIGSPISENSSGSSVYVTPQNGHFKNGVNGMDTANEDSPYSVPSVSNGQERSSIGDGDPVVPLPLSNDSRWSDTSAYARKKVCLKGSYNCKFATFLIIDEILEQTLEENIPFLRLNFGKKSIFRCCNFGSNFQTVTGS